MAQAISRYQTDGRLEHRSGRLDPADDVLLERVHLQPVCRGVRDVAASGEHRPARQHAVEVVLSLVWRDAGLQATDEIEEVIAPTILIEEVHLERPPELDLLVVHVETRRHDADDPAAHTVHLDHAAEGAGCAAEGVLPEFVRENHHILAARCGVLLGERATPRGGNAQRGEQVLAHRRGHRADGLIGAEVCRADAVGSGALERRIEATELGELRRRHPETVEPSPVNWLEMKYSRDGSG